MGVGFAVELRSSETLSAAQLRKAPGENPGAGFVSGGGGIRTHMGLLPPVFKTGAFAVLPPLRMIPTFSPRESRHWAKIDM